MTLDQFRKWQRWITRAVVMLLFLGVVTTGAFAQEQPPVAKPTVELPATPHLRQGDGQQEEALKTLEAETPNSETTKPGTSNSETTKPGTPKRKRLEFTKQVLVYQTFGDEELKCDIYTPAGEGPFPAILAVHGGGWRQGTKFTMLRHAWKMAQAGYVVVAINYRHAPKHPFPAQIHDCKHAIRWMRSKSKEFKIDSDRIGAYGYSAGGHLVSLLGTSDADDGLEGPVLKGLEGYDTRVKAVAAGGAPCEFSWIDDDSGILAYWLGGSPKQKPKAFRAASPQTYVSADDPAFFIYHGTSDLLVPASSPEAFHDSLKQAGVQSQYFAAKNQGHLTTFSDLRWMEKAIDFFDEHLKNDLKPENAQPGGLVD